MSEQGRLLPNKSKVHVDAHKALLDSASSEIRQLNADLAAATARAAAAEASLRSANESLADLQWGWNHQHALLEEIVYACSHGKASLHYPSGRRWLTQARELVEGTAAAPPPAPASDGAYVDGRSCVECGRFITDGEPHEPWCDGNMSVDAPAAAPNKGEPREYVCGGCGKKEPGVWCCDKDGWRMPTTWYYGTDVEAGTEACSLVCLTRFFEGEPAAAPGVERVHLLEAIVETAQQRFARGHPCVCCYWVYEHDSGCDLAALDSGAREGA